MGRHLSFKATPRKVQYCNLWLPPEFKAMLSIFSWLYDLGHFPVGFEDALGLNEMVHNDRLASQHKEGLLSPVDRYRCLDIECSCRGLDLFQFLLRFREGGGWWRVDGFLCFHLFICWCVDFLRKYLLHVYCLLLINISQRIPNYHFIRLFKHHNFKQEYLCHMLQ